MGVRRMLLAVLALGVCVAVLPNPARAATRFDGFTAKAAKGPTLKPLVATFFGGKGNEEFLAVGVQPDGTLVAVGNVWGPESKYEPKPTVLGKGEWYQVNEFVGGQEKVLQETAEGTKEVPAALDNNYPNKAALIVRFSADLQKVLSITQFDWGVGSVQSALIAADGGIILSGMATEHFETLGQQAGFFQAEPQPDDPKVGRFSYQKVFFPGDIYVARISPDAQKLEWARLLKGHRSISQIYQADEGAFVFQCYGVKRLSADGKTLTSLEQKNQRARFLSVSPKDGLMIRGGDQNSGTGREPWRKPLFFGYDKTGTWIWSIYDWAPGLVGHDDFRLVSDSSVRHVVFDPDGNILFFGWSDGGNSVFSQNPVDLEKGANKKNWGISLWGAGVGSFAWLVRIDSKNFDLLSFTPWCGFMADVDKPTSATISHILGLTEGAVAFTGYCGRFLVQTPNPWYRFPAHEGKYPTPGGWGSYLAVFSRDFDHLYFSSAIPAWEPRALCETAKGIVAVARVQENNGDEKKQRPPVLNALQKEFGGGRYDAHILMLEKPVGGGPND